MTKTSKHKAIQCSVPECTKKAQTHRLCKKHGGGIRCKSTNCQKLAQSRGLCVAHGGGRHCAIISCAKLSQYKGLCLVHGGGRRCSMSGCHKFRQIRDLCKSHAKLQMSSAPLRSPSTTVTTAAVVSKLSISFLMNPLASSKVIPNSQSTTVKRPPESPASQNLESFLIDPIDASRYFSTIVENVDQMN
ncbi:hypothetical protein PHMEG_00022334 [Phytophthora megakarya]|uniref:WRKY19-like zinc finger domain-containing protein n=1 Tax=Phytophthora megakarya TaxID=4795 RepID=A0A225VJ07_9STRA|nr:hypothetical protein PHMEG_00022334 [Phytophthora megakarya]